MRSMPRTLLALVFVGTLLTAWLSVRGEPSKLDPAPMGTTEMPSTSNPSQYGVLTSSRWAYGAKFKKESLQPLPNNNPYPEPQPHRDHPFDVAVSVDGKKAYVTLMGSELEPSNQVAVFDVESRKVVKRITVGCSPYYLGVHPGGQYLFVVNRMSNYASVIDTRTDKVVSEVPLDFYCGEVVYNRAGTKAYVANRYLNQVLVLDIDADEDSYHAEVTALGGFDEKEFLGQGSDRRGIVDILRQSCGTARCHAQAKGGYYAGEDGLAAFFSAIENSSPGDPDDSVLLQAVRSVDEGGFADDLAGSNFHAAGLVVWKKSDPDYQRVARWIAKARYGPGIPVGNFGSKPGVLALSHDETRLYVGNQGTQEISIIDLKTNEEVTGIYTQNVITALDLYRDEANERDLLIALSMGIGFGAAKERDPYGGETEDREHPAAQFTLLRDLNTTEPFADEGPKCSRTIRRHRRYGRVQDGGYPERRDGDRRDKPEGPPSLAKRSAAIRPASQPLRGPRRLGPLHFRLGRGLAS